MKSFLLVLIYSSCCAFWLTGCGEQASESNPYFIGIWDGSDGANSYRLSIDRQSSGYWHKSRMGPVQGVARIKHDKLYIGLKQFNIEVPPAADSTGHWSLKLSGVTYYRQ